MTDETSPNGTFAVGGSLPAISFDDMRKLVLEMTKEPMLKEIRCDHWARAKIRWHLDAEYWENQKRYGISTPQPLNVYFRCGAVPVVIDDTLMIGEWKAIDTEGNVIDQGNLLHPDLP